MDKKVLYDLSYGVYLTTTMDGERPTGCVTNSVMQITSEPATVAVSINHDNYTNGCISRSGRFAVSVLSETSDPSIIGTFGFQSGKTVNKFDSVEYEQKANLPVVKDSCAWIVCEVIDRMETATHTVFLGKVVDADEQGAGEPMTYAYYHKVIRGKSPKNAPTYLPEDEKAQEARWVCSVCGYIYDGETPFEQLPDSFVCPVCRQPKSAFVKK